MQLESTGLQLQHQLILARILDIGRTMLAEDQVQLTHGITPNVQVIGLASRRDMDRTGMAILGLRHLATQRRTLSIIKTPLNPLTSTERLDATHPGIDTVSMNRIE